MTSSVTAADADLGSAQHAQFLNEFLRDISNAPSRADDDVLRKPGSKEVLPELVGDFGASGTLASTGRSLPGVRDGPQDWLHEIAVEYLSEDRDIVDCGLIERTDLHSAGWAFRNWVAGEIDDNVALQYVAEQVAFANTDCGGLLGWGSGQHETSRTTGGVLGAAVGGVVTVCTDPGLFQWLQEHVFSLGPQQAVEEAAEAMVGELRMEDPTGYPGQPVGVMIQAASSDVNLAYRRGVHVRAKTEDEGGAAYLRWQVRLELVNALRTEVARVSEGMRSPKKRPKVDDDVILREIRLTQQQVIEDTRQLGTEGPGAATDLNSSIDEYLVRLFKIQSSLQHTLEILQTEGNYAALGVSPDCTDAELKKAYKEACRKHHPDKGGDTRLFQFLQRAYEFIVEDRKNGKRPSARPKEAAPKPGPRCPPPPPAGSCPPTESATHPGPSSATPAGGPEPAGEREMDPAGAPVEGCASPEPAPPSGPLEELAALAAAAQVAADAASEASQRSVRMTLEACAGNVPGPQALGVAVRATEQGMDCVEQSKRAGEFVQKVAEKLVTLGCPGLLDVAETCVTAADDATDAAKFSGSVLGGSLQALTRCGEQFSEDGGEVLMDLLATVAEAVQNCANAAMRGALCAGRGLAQARRALAEPESSSASENGEAEEQQPDAESQERRRHSQPRRPGDTNSNSGEGAGAGAPQGGDSQEAGKSSRPHRSGRQKQWPMEEQIEYRLKNWQLLSKLVQEMQQTQRSICSMLSANPLLLPKVGATQQDQLFRTLKGLFAEASASLRAALAVPVHDMGPVLRHHFRFLELVGHPAAPVDMTARLIRLCALLDKDRCQRTIKRELFAEDSGTRLRVTSQADRAAVDALEADALRWVDDFVANAGVQLFSS
mmetsp:Transcript_9061/g.21655  ORF Transcript_9061/g.21655 Transcript_9061/m.21655 type:complete len:888 (+) Transcript_9061:19-2682(+)